VGLARDAVTFATLVERLALPRRARVVDAGAARHADVCAMERDAPAAGAAAVGARDGSVRVSLARRTPTGRRYAIAGELGVERASVRCRIRRLRCVDEVPIAARAGRQEENEESHPWEAITACASARGDLQNNPTSNPVDIVWPHMVTYGHQGKVGVCQR
jgi:hypothetical protein